MYFTNPSDTLQYNGSEVAGIKKGDNLTTVIEKLASEVDRLTSELSAVSKQKTVAPASTDSLENKNSFGTTSGFIDSSYSAKVNVTPKSNSVDVFFDLNSIGSGDKTYSRVFVEGFRNGVSTVLVDSDKMSNGFILSPDAFPATMSIEVRRKAQDGSTSIYTTSIPLSSTTKSGDYPVFSKAINSSDLKTQTDVNQFLFDQILSIQKTVANNLNVDGGTKNVATAIAELQSDIEDLKKQDVASSKIIYSNGEGNVTKTLQEAIGDITSSVNALASDSNTKRV